MSKLLSLATLMATAQPVFAANPDADKVFATADGNVFLPHALNLARHHGRQNGLEVHEISRVGRVSDDLLDHIATDAEANELKRAADEAAAKNTAATVPPATGEAVPVEAAAVAQAVGKAKAVRKTDQATDAPANEGPANPNVLEGPTDTDTDTDEAALAALATKPAEEAAIGTAAAALGVEVPAEVPATKPTTKLAAAKPTKPTE